MLTLVFDAKQGHIQEKFAILASLSIDCLTRYSTLPDYLVMKQTYAINNFYYPGIHIIRARDITQKMPADHPHGHNGKFLACILLACKDIWSTTITICSAFFMLAKQESRLAHHVFIDEVADECIGTQACESPVRWA